jgi:hypothetical protein
VLPKTGSFPLSSRLVSLAHEVGRIHLAVVGGVTVGADIPIRMSDLQAAGRGGRLINGIVPFGDSDDRHAGGAW